jgi:hypothetical protein
MTKFDLPADRLPVVIFWLESQGYKNTRDYLVQITTITVFNYQLSELIELQFSEWISQ